MNDTAIELVVRPNDLDALQHVNNATALEYLETGRWDWMHNNGLTWGGRVVAVVARLEIDYRRPLLRGRVLVRTAMVSDIEPDDATYQAIFEQHIHQGDDEPAVSAKLQVAFFDTTTGTLTTAQHFLGLEEP